MVVPANLPARPRFPYQDSARAHQREVRRAEGQRILARSRETAASNAQKPSLEDRISNRRALNALPFSDPTPPTHTRSQPPDLPIRSRIAEKSVIFDFKKLTTADLVRIFTPKLEATLKRLRVFDDVEPEQDDFPERFDDVQKLITRLKHYRETLKDTSTVRTREEFQSWNFGLKEIQKISFVGFRKNRRAIIRQLSDVWRSSYFEYL